MLSDAAIVLYIVRHGTTEMNEQNIFRGNADPDLDKQGRQDAHLLADFFEPIDCYPTIVSSDKRRARNTAAIIASRKAVVVETNEGLRPWDIGDFGGQPKNEATLKKLRHYIANPDECPPKGESLNAAHARVVPLLHEAAELADQYGEPMILVVHSSVMHMAGETFGTHHEDAHVKPGGVAAVFWDGHKLDVEPIFKADERSKSQNVLGTKKGSLTS